MSAVTFLFLLSCFTVITGLITEAIKKIANDKTNLPYNIVSLIIAMLVGIGGCFIYYQLNKIDINVDNVIYAVLMGLAATLASQVGYDKVKQAIEQLMGDKK